jgi:heme/copper-type cytochrome/quinol oxidase subunit 2
VRILRLPVNDSGNGDLFDVRFYKTESTIHQKPTPHTTFLTMKQKRYARKKVILPRTIFYKDESGKKTNKVKFSGRLLLANNEIFKENYADATKQYRMFRKNKKRYENTSVLLSRRMLRTRRTLVLPAHVNLTAITNSYDVIHSWFIPGLGLKMDAIPGRATHHTFYIDNVGFYYGQCAEICGRYHHHMPIRICALPFEHFLV